MAWSSPRTWTPLETVTAALMNLHVRDNLNLLKTRIADDGSLKAQLFGVGQAAGAGNVGSTETDPLPGYTFSLPANYLGNGECLLMRGSLTVANNANAKTLRLRIGSGAAIPLWSSSLAIASHFGFFDVIIIPRSSTTAVVQGVYYKDCAAGAIPTVILNPGYMTGLNFATVQTLRLTGQGGATNDMIMSEWLVAQYRGAGTLR